MGSTTWDQTRDYYGLHGNFDIVNERFVCEQADALASTGMRDAGYNYLVIDDCWEAGERDCEGSLQADPQKFPHGMKAVADYVHGRGLKFGIYTCAGPTTCQGYPASYENEFRDAALFASWEVDFVKVDWCDACNMGLNAKKQYTIWRDAILATGRPMVLSICEWGSQEPWKWGRGVGHMWRTTGDREPTWESFLSILDAQKGLECYAGPGHWNDCDILEVGNGNFTDEENRTQFSLWCMLASPLFAGNDLTQMSAATRKILTARDVIAVNQDPAGVQGTCVRKGDNFEVWVKPLGNRRGRRNEFAALIFNRGSEEQKIPLLWQDLGLCKDAHLHVQDLWERADLGIRCNALNLRVPPHGVRMLRLRTENDETKWSVVHWYVPPKNSGA